MAIAVMRSMGDGWDEGRDEGEDGHEDRHEGNEGSKGEENEGNEGWHEGNENETCVENRPRHSREIRCSFGQEREDCWRAAQAGPHKERQREGCVSEDVCARETCVGRQQVADVERRRQKGQKRAWAGSKLKMWNDAVKKA